MSSLVNISAGVPLITILGASVVVVGLIVVVVWLLTGANLMPLKAVFTAAVAITEHADVAPVSVDRDDCVRVGLCRRGVKGRYNPPVVDAARPLQPVASPVFKV